MYGCIDLFIVFIYFVATSLAMAVTLIWNNYAQQRQHAFAKKNLWANWSESQWF